MTKRGSKHNISRDEYLELAHVYSKRGNDLPHARLTPSIVRQIRFNRNGWTARQWAEHLGVHLRTIEAVREYRNWSWVK